MDQEVRITSDGTREVAVGIQAQTVMAQVLQAVMSSGHATEEQRGYERLLPAARYGRKHLLDGIGVRHGQLASHLPREPFGFLEHGQEGGDAVSSRRLVAAEGTGIATLFQVEGNSLVSEDHGLFDELSGTGLLTHFDGPRLPRLIKADLRFLRAELKASIPLPMLLARLGYTVGHLKARTDLLELLGADARHRPVSFEDIQSPVIVQPRPGAHDGRIDVHTHRLQFRIQEDIHRHA